MAVTKCNNCGASIPKDAAFCPGCGAPKGAGQPAPQPVQAQPIVPATPMAQRGSSPLEGLFDMVFSKTAIILTVAIGILLAWIGLLIAIFSTANINIATLLNSTGFAGIGLITIGGGIWNKKIDKYVRVGLVVVGGASIVWAVSVSSLLGALVSLSSQGINYFP